MNLRGLVHRDLGEGMTEKELATAVGVSVQTITNILADNLPQNPTILETFTRHFRIHPDILQFAGSLHPEGLFDLTESVYASHSAQ